MRKLTQDILAVSSIVEKIQTNEMYAQNMYAAFCNNVFMKEEQEWSCSWRAAGRFISEVRGEGDYIDWYCSGMFEREGHVAESVITPEVQADITLCGWVIKEDSYSDDIPLTY